MNKANIDIDTTFKYYYRPLCLYAIHYVRNMELAEDIVQDFMGKAQRTGASD